MAITNKEILEKQVKRINEKMKTNFSLKKANGLWYLCIENNGYDMSPWPLNASMTRRKTSEMLEYLRGVEDAVDFYTHCGTASAG